MRCIIPPQACFLCGALGPDLLCAECVQDLVYQDRICVRCGCALPFNAGLCGECQRAPPYFFRARAPLAYAYPADRLVMAVKFGRNLAVLRFLGQLMARAQLFSPPLPDVLVPVPLHPAALRVRGFNQAAELAKYVARALEVPLVLDACRCIKRKRQQSSLPDVERKRNVRGAFRVVRRQPEWKHIGIVDDVMTTGATANEVARMWLKAGAEQVSVGCCTRRN